MEYQTPLDVYGEPICNPYYTFYNECIINICRGGYGGTGPTVSILHFNPQIGDYEIPSDYYVGETYILNGFMLNDNYCKKTDNIEEEYEKYKANPSNFNSTKYVDLKFSFIVQISKLDEGKSTVNYLDNFSNIVKPGEEKMHSFQWLPKEKGQYIIERFIVYDIKNPIPLAPKHVTYVDVYEKQERFHGNTISPIKQFKSGIPIDEIQCKDGFVVVLKASNGNPNCVKRETLEKLRERGWAEPLGDIINQRTVQSKPEPEPMKLSELGKLTTISEYNIKTSVGNVSMPTYLPPEIRIESERLHGDITTFFCLPNSIQSNDNLTLTQIQKQGLVIQITRNYDNNNWKKTVEFLVEEAPEVRSKSTFKGLDILLVHSKEFNEYHAITSVDNIKIEIFSEKFDDLQLEKVLKSMFNA